MTHLSNNIKNRPQCLLQWRLMGNYQLRKCADKHCCRFDIDTIQWWNRRFPYLSPPKMGWINTTMRCLKMTNLTFIYYCKTRNRGFLHKSIWKSVQIEDLDFLSTFVFENVFIKNIFKKHFGKWFWLGCPSCFWRTSLRHCAKMTRKKNKCLASCRFG